MPPMIEENLNIQKILKKSSKKWDGGYAIAGMLGHGDSFVMRDPAGIRPAFYYKDEEVVVVASERPAIQNAFNVDIKSIKELEPGSAIIVKNKGEVTIKKINKKAAIKACSFERIYFSRGNDADIYSERKNLGKLIMPKVLNEINFDIKNTVFSYIPNTAETSFFGMAEA
jgi:amidophosphoribosyltransferase